MSRGIRHQYKNAEFAEAHTIFREHSLKNGKKQEQSKQEHCSGDDNAHLFIKSQLVHSQAPSGYDMFFIRKLEEAFCNDINKVATGEFTEWRMESLAAFRA